MYLVYIFVLQGDFKLLGFYSQIIQDYQFGRTTYHIYVKLMYQILTFVKKDKPPVELPPQLLSGPFRFEGTIIAE